MADPATGSVPDQSSPLVETTWTNGPAVVVFAAGAVTAGVAVIEPAWSAVVGVGFPLNLILAGLWSLLAAFNARRRLMVYPDVIVIRSWIGTTRELRRDQWNCLAVCDARAIPWWQRVWSGSQQRPMLLAVPGSPCRSLFAGAAMTGIPLTGQTADQVAALVGSSQPND